MTVYIVIIPAFFIIITEESIINIYCKTFMCIMLTWKDTQEAINLNCSVFSSLPPDRLKCKALMLLDTVLKALPSL